MPAMKKNEKIMIILILVAVAAFVILDPYHIIRSDDSDTTKKSASRQKQVKEKASEKIGGETDLSGEMERISVSGWKRDPFVRTRPDLEEDALISTLRLSAISVKGEDRMAMINSKPVRVGDTIKGLEVRKIESGKVTLQSGENSYTLTWER